MTWQGKLLGGSLGSFLGPWGAVAGATAGHYLIDRKARRAPNLSDTKQLVVLVATTLGQLARVDQKINEREIRVIYQILEELSRALRLTFQPREINSLLLQTQRQAIPDARARLAASVAPQIDLAYATLAWLWRVAVSDQNIHPSEYDFVQQYATHLPLAADDLQASAQLYLRHTYGSQELQEAYAILGVPQQADQHTLKTAYRKLSQIYHPDKHANLDPAIQALTADKFTQIKKAYELLNTNEPPSATLYCKSGANRQLLRAQPRMPVFCFQCHTIQQLPELNHIPQARCHRCQSLLAFEQPLADALFQMGG